MMNIFTLQTIVVPYPFLGMVVGAVSLCTVLALRDCHTRRVAKKQQRVTVPGDELYND